MGRKSGVAVVAKDGTSVEEQDVIDFVAERVSKFKKPSRVWILRVIPKTATGKVQRRKVADAMLAKDQPKAKL